MSAIHLWLGIALLFIALYLWQYSKRRKGFFFRGDTINTLAGGANTSGPSSAISGGAETPQGTDQRGFMWPLNVPPTHPQTRDILRRK
jgi:hypothetical protein